MSCMIGGRSESAPLVIKVKNPLVFKPEMN